MSCGYADLEEILQRLGVEAGWRQFHRTSGTAAFARRLNDEAEMTSIVFCRGEIDRIRIER